MSNSKLRCAMSENCTDCVSHIDKSGFVYCAKHGAIRKGYVPCRKLKPKELTLIQSGIPLARY